MSRLLRNHFKLVVIYVEQIIITCWCCWPGGGDGGVLPVDLPPTPVPPAPPPPPPNIPPTPAPSDIALVKGVFPPPTFCPAPADVGSTGGIPGRVVADVAAVVVVVDVAALEAASPGATAAAASFTSPTMPPSSPPAAWPTWFMAPPAVEVPLNWDET